MNHLSRCGKGPIDEACPYSVLKMNVAISWSGGKDACLATALAKESGLTPVVLLCMVDQRGFSRSNGVSKAVLQKQAKQMTLPIVFIKAEWEEYEHQLEKALQAQKEQRGISGCVFGDIEGRANKAFEDALCNRVGLMAHLPLYGRDKEWIIEQCQVHSILSFISVVRNNLSVSHDLIGKPYHSLETKWLEKHDIDICGEKGEFHTVVYHAGSLGISLNLYETKRYELETVLLCLFDI